MFRENETPKKVGNGTGKGLSVPRSDPFPATFLVLHIPLMRRCNIALLWRDDQ